MDWTEWHGSYERDPSLKARLAIVRLQISDALSASPAGPVRLVSVCAGDGRDVIGALTNHPRRNDIAAALIDLHTDSIRRGRAMAKAVGFEAQLSFIEADAGLAKNYINIAPADILVLSGFIGHLHNNSVPNLISSLPMLCKPGGSVIWNRHLVLNDGKSQVPRIRQLLERQQFRECEYKIASRDGFATGRVVFQGQTLPLNMTDVLFEFIGLGKLKQFGQVH
jgi:hypothetical protein